MIKITCGSFNNTFHFYRPSHCSNIFKAGKVAYRITFKQTELFFYIYYFMSKKPFIYFKKRGIVCIYHFRKTHRYTGFPPNKTIWQGYEGSSKPQCIILSFYESSIIKNGILVYPIIFFVER